MTETLANIVYLMQTCLQNNIFEVECKQILDKKGVAEPPVVCKGHRRRIGKRRRFQQSPAVPILLMVVQYLYSCFFY